MAGQDKIKVVMVAPPPWSRSPDDSMLDSGFQHTTTVKYETLSVSKSTIAESKFLDSPVSAQLGFPVKAIPCDVAPEMKHNDYIDIFFIDADTSSPTFGGISMSAAYGEFMFVRCDGKDLEAEQLDLLYGYINKAMGIAVTEEFRKLPQEIQNSMKEDIQKSLTAEAFASYYLEHRRKMIARGDQYWSKLDHPFNVDDGPAENSCAVCGAQERKDGQTLRVCAGCKNVWYCSRQCQRGDWKRHKNVCKETSSQPGAAATKPTTSSYVVARSLPRAKAERVRANTQEASRME